VNWYSTVCLILGLVISKGVPFSIRYRLFVRNPNLLEEVFKLVLVIKMVV